MYVTGSDAWNSQKQMSEVRIGGKARANCGRVYPTPRGAATNGRACFALRERDFRPHRPEPFAYSVPAPIFGS